MIRILSAMLPTYQPPFGLRNGAPEFLRRFKPFLDGRFHIGYCLLVGRSICRAAGELWDFRYKGLILIAPVNDDLVANSSGHLLTGLATSSCERVPLGSNVVDLGRVPMMRTPGACPGHRCGVRRGDHAIGLTERWESP